MTGDTYPYRQFGKPSRETYEYAKNLLLSHATELGGPKAPDAPEPNM